MQGFKKRYIGFGHTRAINTAEKMPMGTPMAIAPAVTYKLPTIIGKIPNSGGVSEGDQLRPNKNFMGPIFAMAGMPFTNKNKQINATAKMEVSADMKKTAFITFSFLDCIRILNSTKGRSNPPDLVYACLSGLYLNIRPQLYFAGEDCFDLFTGHVFDGIRCIYDDRDAIHRNGDIVKLFLFTIL